jgi:SanA protein
MRGKLIIKIIILGFFISILPWLYISVSTAPQIYRNVADIPAREVWLLLGTTPGVNNSNLYFRTRIEGAKELYERGKIRHILVSWDNANASYNEPELMKLALIKAWIPETAITLDYAGFRTLDSVVRAREIFSLSGNITVISQPFHVERALFIAKYSGVDAIGYWVANVSPSLGLIPYIREIAARCLAVYDVLFSTEATVLGEKETLNRAD